MIKLTKTPDVD